MVESEGRTNNLGGKTMVLVAEWFGCYAAQPAKLRITFVSQIHTVMPACRHHGM